MNFDSSYTATRVYKFAKKAIVFDFWKFCIGTFSIALNTSTRYKYYTLFVHVWMNLERTIWMENITRVFCIVLYCLFGFLVVAEMPKTSRFRALKGLPCVCTLHAVIVNCIENEQCTRGKVCATPSIHPSVQWENVWKR